MSYQKLKEVSYPDGFVAKQAGSGFGLPGYKTDPKVLRAIEDLAQQCDEMRRRIVVIHHPSDEVRTNFLHNLAAVLILTCMCTLGLSYGLDVAFQHIKFSITGYIFSIGALPTLLIFRKVSFAHSIGYAGQAFLFFAVVVCASFFAVAIHKWCGLAIFSNALVIQIMILVLLAFNPIYWFCVNDKGKSRKSQSSSSSSWCDCYSKHYMVLSLAYLVTAIVVFGYLLELWIFEEHGQEMSFREWFFPPPNAVFILINLLMALFITGSMFLFMAVAFNSCQQDDYVVGALDVFMNMMLLITFFIWLTLDVIRANLQCNRCISH